MAFWLFTFYFFYVARFIVKRLQDIVARKHGRDWRRAGALTREKGRVREREREREKEFGCVLAIVCMEGECVCVTGRAR